MWRFVLGAFAMLALLAGSYAAGGRAQADRCAAAQRQAQLADAAADTARDRAAFVQAQAASDAAAGAAAAAAAARVEIRWRTQTLIKEVPRYVTPASDARFAVPYGLVRLHDAAALGVEPGALPDPAGRADDSAASVAASDLAAVIAENYGACRQAIDRLSRAQAWISSLTQPAGTPAAPAS